LNTTQQIRRDGKIEMALKGEVHAAGLTPADLEKKVLELYGPDLVLKEVSVTLQSSSYPVYVNGAVVHPGKIMIVRPSTVLEAIMEAGGFDLARANMKGVRVVRDEDGQLKYFVLNLKEVLEGKRSRTLCTRPNDIIYVPEKAF
jgi:polysaccharide export outer membrane protein